MADKGFLFELKLSIAEALDVHIRPLFKPGVKLSLCARTPGNDEADVLVSDDSMESIEAFVERAKGREPV